MGIHVEVCVQDCYSYTDCSAVDSSATDASATDASDADSGNVAAIADQLVTDPAVRDGTVSAEQWEHWFQQWLNQLQPDLSPIQAYELSVRLTSDREIHRLNAQYRQQDKPTDVLAFAALEIDTPETDEWQTLPLYLGDIVISVDTAQRQATTQGHDLRTELAWLASHGLLHLLGWDHPDDDRLEQMLAQQKALLNTVGVSIMGS